MSGPVELTPDALESLLSERDGEAFVAFVIDVYERTGREAKREGDIVTTTAPDGDRKRLLVWTDDRTRIERLLGADQPDPDVEAVDAVVTRDRDAATASLIAERTGAELLGTDDLHDRLLYAMDREACRDLCRTHFDRAVEPRPVSADDSEGTAFGALSRPRIALVAVVACGLLVAGAVGFPGARTPDGDAFVPGNGSDAAGPLGEPVTPVGGAPEVTPTPTPTVVTPNLTPPLPPLADPAVLEPCSDPVGGLPEPCLPPRPFSANHDPSVTAGSATRINGTFGNPYDSDITGGLVGVETPPGWRLRLASGSGAIFDAVGDGYLPIGKLAPAESRNVSWELVPRDITPGGRYNVTVISEWTAPEYDGPERTDENYFRLPRNLTYRVAPAQCRDVEPCSLLAGDSGGTEPFEISAARIGATNTTAGHAYNPHSEAVTNGTITLEPPNAEWTVTPVNGTSFETLAPGESRSIAWNITVPESADCWSAYTFRGSATYELEGGERLTVPFAVSVSPDTGDGCYIPR